MVCIPWIFEYFSYSRGYAVAISFFFTAIAFIIKWKQSGKLIHFALIFASLTLTVASSLTYLMPSMLIFLFVGLLVVLNPQGQKQKWLMIGSIMLIFLISLVPFIRYSFELKDAGALWWGNQNGLWESTGKSLSSLVLFSEATWIFYLVCSALAFGVVSFIISWKEKGLWGYLKETEAMILLILIGALTGIVLMRYLLDVNYPMDRVGMFLVPLFILFLGVFLSKYRYTTYGVIALSFFPISFLLNLNVSTSIFSPEDRIPTYLSNEIKEIIDDETALSAEYVSHMSYAYSCRNDETVHMAFTAQAQVKNEENSLGDYHIDWLGRETIDGFSKIRQDSESHTNFLKRDESPDRLLIKDTIIEKVSTSEMYFTLLNYDLNDSLKSKQVQFEVSSEMDFDQTTRSFNLIRAIEDKAGITTSTSSPRFDWYFSDRTDVNFTFVDRPFHLKPGSGSISLFLMNGDVRKIDIEFLRIRIYQVEP
jgi:hypothetical protein